MRKTVALLVLLSGVAVPAQTLEPRLPPPAETSSENEALIQRAQALYASRNYRESAATWQTIAAREAPIASFAQRESVRALIAAGDIEAALTGLTALGKD